MILYLIKLIRLIMHLSRYLLFMNYTKFRCVCVCDIHGGSVLKEK